MPAELDQIEQIGRDLAQKHGLTLIPPYDHFDVICGQGTAAIANSRGFSGSYSSTQAWSWASAAPVGADSVWPMPIRTAQEALTQRPLTFLRSSWPWRTGSSRNWARRASALTAVRTPWSMT